MTPYWFPALWLAWAAYWLIVSRGVKAESRRESIVSRLPRIAALAVSVGLLWIDRLPMVALTRRFFAWAPWQFWLALALTAIGLSFAVWARARLGSNWSATVTLKHEHELVTDGPYAIVRHPIYSGIIFALIGSAFARNDLRAVLAVAIAIVSFWFKLRLEERWMAEQFGVQYARYAQRVPMLFPFFR